MQKNLIKVSKKINVWVGNGKEGVNTYSSWGLSEIWMQAAYLGFETSI